MLKDLSTGDPDNWLWEFSDKGYATDQNPTHTFSKRGKYTISLTASNAGGVDVISKTVYIKIESGTGITEELAEENEISVYPNPAKDYFNISLQKNMLNSGTVKVKIYDISGSQVYDNTFVADSEIRISTESFSNKGSQYIVQVVVNGTTFSKQLVLMKYKMKPKHEKENNKSGL
jgi:PKD repeat protein